MKGLIRKDFYLLWNYCRLIPLFLLAFIIFSAFSSDGQSPFFIYYPCILSSTLPVNLLAYDDAEHWLTYCDTLPVTRRQYVCGKYIMSLICGGTIFLLSAIAAVIRLCRNGAFCPADLTDQLAVLSTISLLSSALTMPPLFKFGAQKGRIVFIGVVGIFCGLAAILDTPDLSGVSLPIALLPILAMVIFAVSWLLSIRFYEKREI